MMLHLHQTHQTIADFQAILGYLSEHFEKNPKEGLHLFPELFLTGYPLQDLVLQKSFIEGYHQFLEKLNEWCQKKFIANPEKIALLATGPLYQIDENGLPLKIENVIYHIAPTKKIEAIYTKQLLPNYDIFDEKKYYSAGNQNGFFKFQNKRIALTICEDMWPSTNHERDPIVELYRELEIKKERVDLVINLSASPFHVGKHESRVKRAKEIALQIGAPFAYVNRVGGEDEILFDGSSFIHDGVKPILHAPSFKADILSTPLPPFEGKRESRLSLKTENTWESLFSPQIDLSTKPARLRPLSDHDCEVILAALGFGIHEYAKKSGFNKFLVALSGGIDSSLVLAIMKLFLKPNQSLEAIYMPGLFSSPLSWDLSLELCKKIGVPLHSVPIKFLHSAYRNAFREHLHAELKDLSDENIQSRIRGSLLYARSNQTNAMVLNTSNKSEIAVGYSTLYGDSVGAISVLGDLYKTEIFELANYINRRHGNLIPEGIITRPPSAELRPNQKDEDTLPPYAKLDAILEGILSYRMSAKDIVALGFNHEEVLKVMKLYMTAEYKRKQFCPIIKVYPKSFGFGYRVPISKNNRFYTQAIS